MTQYSLKKIQENELSTETILKIFSKKEDSFFLKENDLLSLKLKNMESVLLITKNDIFKITCYIDNKLSPSFEFIRIKNNKNLK